MITVPRNDFRVAARKYGFADPNIVFKDHKVVRVLSALAAHDFGGPKLIFAGGTCLARAHRIIDRMSEDIDLKVSLPDLSSMSKNAVRKALSQVKKDALAAIEATGLSVPEENIRSRNGNQYIAFRIPYGGEAAPGSVLDDMIQLELVCKQTRLPTTNRPVQSLLSQAFDNAPEADSIECISLEETAAEKLVSLTRRVAARLENARPDVPFDRRLIRHVYDLYCMRDHLDLKVVGELASEIALSDAEEFRNQNPEYHKDPQKWTWKALEDLSYAVMHREDYDVFLREMVYGNKPSYDEAIAVVNQMADSFSLEAPRGDLGDGYTDESGGLAP